MQTHKTVHNKQLTDPYSILLERMQSLLPEHARQVNIAFFHDIAFYIRKRMKTYIDEAGVLALLEGALVRLEGKVSSPDSKLLNPIAYYRTIIRNLVNDYYRDMLSDERFMISPESLEILSVSGFPKDALEVLSASTSRKLLTLRTLRGKLKSTFDDLGIHQNQRHYLQREAIKAFRFQVSIQLEKSQLENISPGQSENTSLSQLGDCLNQFQKKDRDLIRLKFGLDGVHYSFEEIRDLYQAASTRQIQNRYYYLLKGLRSCLETKGYRFG